MTLTNHAGLPAPLLRAVAWSNRDTEGCDYTVTQLLRPARQAALEAQHADAITEDAADRLWALLGSAGHEVLRRSAPGGIVEERAVVDLEVDGKLFKVGGQLDYAVTDDTLWDFKITSVWAVKDGVKSEWVAQVNAYKWLASHYGVAFERMNILAILRDWSVREAARSPEYPQTQAKVLAVPVWSSLQTLLWIKDRIRAHEAAKLALPECTPEETWEQPTRWAVKKPANQRATKLYATEADAQEHVARESKLVVEKRSGERPRCESYCRASFACAQFQAWKTQQ